MRSTNSVTSSSLKALASDSIGTACRTLANLAAGTAPTRCERLPGVRSAGKRASIAS